MTAAGLPRARDPQRLGFQFRMAFQPIVDAARREVFAQEALVRGPQGEGAGEVLAQVDETNRYAFDQACRTRAIKRASRIDPGARISINFLPNAVYDPAMCIRTSLSVAEACNVPTENIIFEVTEGERVTDLGHLQEVIRAYGEHGFRIALDDFGSGYSSLELLAELAPDLVKLDKSLIRGIDSDPRRHAIARGNLQACRDLGIDVIAEGVETYAELAALRELGIELVQGYLFARPALDKMHRAAELTGPLDRMAAQSTPAQ
jgi:EAL domain-containing protein (putative c-di-GMP-specific phosphodiesterase class I)